MNNESAFPVLVPDGDTKQPGLTKHEIGAFMIAQGLVSNYTLKTPEDQGIIAQLSYELAAEIINRFK